MPTKLDGPYGNTPVVKLKETQMSYVFILSMALFLTACAGGTSYLNPGETYRNEGEQKAVIVLVKTLKPGESFTNTLRDTLRVFPNQRLYHLFLTEALHDAQFTAEEEKLKYIDRAIKKNDQALRELKRP